MRCVRPTCARPRRESKDPDDSRGRYSPPTHHLTHAVFVFGKKTAKLRLNKVRLQARRSLRRRAQPLTPSPIDHTHQQLSELIHKSAEYPSLDFARVTVFFQVRLHQRPVS